MTTDIKVNASVTANGEEAAAKLKGLAASVADAKIELQRAKAEAKALDAEIKALNKSTDGAGKVTAEYHNRLRELTAQETLAADAARKAQAAFDAHARGLGGVTQSAGSARASMVNFGQQIGDISQGFAAGVNPAMIFAQQAGQVAFALQGMEGKLKGVGAFLGGPWGIALTSALVLLSPFVSKLFEGGDAADAQAEKTKPLAEAIRDLDRATGLANKSAAEGIRLSELATAAAIKEAKEKRDAAKATLDEAEARLETARAEQNAARARGSNFGLNFVTDTAAAEADAARKRYQELRDQIEAAEKAAAKSAAFGRADLAARAATDPAEKIRQQTEARITALKALNLEETEYTRRLTAIRADEKAAIDGLTQAHKADAAAKREATAAAKDYQSSIESMVAAVTKTNNALRGGLALPGLTLSVRNAEAAKAKADADARQADRVQSGLAEAVDAASDRLQAGVGTAGETMGRTAGNAFAETASAAASVIGQIIGGKAGSTIQSAVQLLGGLTKDGAAPAGLASFTSAFTASNKSLKDALTNLLGKDSKFGETAGKAFAGASQGVFASSIASAVGVKTNGTGAALGGALGGSLSKYLTGSLAFLGPFAGIAGGLLGGVIGGLLVKPPKGSTTVSASGGNVTQTSAGDPTVQKATSALGTGIGSAISAIAEQLGGSVGNFAVSIGQSGKYYRVDGSGAGRTNKKLAGVQAFGEDQAAAVQAAIADAIRDGGVAGVSPRVQSALQRYATDVNKAVAEAMKVKGLEDLLANQANPFASAFKDFETQAAARLKVARDYGFNVLAIEKLNAEQRAAVIQQTLSQATGSVRQLLDDLKFGDRAEGSISERRAALVAEQNRLAGLVRGGDASQLNGLSSVVQKLLDLDKEAGGIGGGFATSRASSIDLLNELVAQTEDRIRAASAAAQSAANGTADKTAAQLDELNASTDESVVTQQSILAELRKLNAAFAGGSGGAAGVARQLDLSAFARVL